jgi:hypothetical protein
MDLDKVTTQGIPSRGDLSPQEKRNMLEDSHKPSTYVLQKPYIAKYKDEIAVENNDNPDKAIPESLFNFDLILNSRRFNVVCSNLLRIRNEEDLTEISESELQLSLERCASYRMTCFCAYIAAKKSLKGWEATFEDWIAGKRQDARQFLKMKRIEERHQGLRKDLGQITAQEVEDYIRTTYTKEYTELKEHVEEWEENSEIFLELRDTLKDRGMHLQTLLKRSQDHLAPPMSQAE